MGVSVLSLFALVEYLYKKTQAILSKKKTTTKVQAFEVETVSNDKH
jgi:hypothetical protein